LLKAQSLSKGKRHKEGGTLHPVAMLKFGLRFR
jgi:hypothetical protein